MTRRFVFLIAVATALLPATSFAQQARGAGAVMEACKAEIGTVCASSSDSRGATIKCLADNKAKLGGDCAAALKTAEERRAKFMAACQGDLDKLCPASAGGNRFACLRTKATEISKPCADVLAAAIPPGDAKQ